MKNSENENNGEMEKYDKRRVFCDNRMNKPKYWIPKPAQHLKQEVQEYPFSPYGHRPKDKNPKDEDMRIQQTTPTDQEKHTKPSDMTDLAN